MEHLSLITTGFAIVIGVLLGLWMVSALVAIAFKEKATPEKPSPAPGTDENIPAHHVAAIAAAVATVMPGTHRITNIKAPPHIVPGWEEEGRIEQALSHRTRWDWEIPGPPHVEFKTKETKRK